MNITVNDKWLLGFIKWSTKFYMEITQTKYWKEKNKKYSTMEKTHKHTHGTTHIFYMVVLFCFSLRCISGSCSSSITKNIFEDLEICWMAVFCWDKCLSGSSINACVRVCGVVTLGWGWPLPWIHCRNHQGNDLSTTSTSTPTTEKWQEQFREKFWEKPKPCASLYHWPQVPKCTF